MLYKNNRFMLYKNNRFMLYKMSMSCIYGKNNDDIMFYLFNGINEQNWPFQPELPYKCYPYDD